MNADITFGRFEPAESLSCGINECLHHLKLSLTRTRLALQGGRFGSSHNQGYCFITLARADEAWAYEQQRGSMVADWYDQRGQRKVCFYQVRIANVFHMHFFPAMHSLFFASQTWLLISVLTFFPLAAIRRCWNISCAQARSSILKVRCHNSVFCP